MPNRSTTPIEGCLIIGFIVLFIVVLAISFFWPRRYFEDKGYSVNNPTCVLVEKVERVEYERGGKVNWTTLIICNDRTIEVPGRVLLSDAKGYYVINSKYPNMIELGPYPNCPLKQ